MLVWPWETDRNHIMPNQVNQMDGVTLGCCTWLEMYEKFIPNELICYPWLLLEQFKSIFLSFHEVYVKIIMLGNCSTFYNLVKINDHVNIEKEPSRWTRICSLGCFKIINKDVCPYWFDYRLPKRLYNDPVFRQRLLVFFSLLILCLLSRLSISKERP